MHDTPAHDALDCLSIEAVLRLLQVYREHVPSGSVMFLHTFLLIAARRPIVQTEIARLLGLSQPSVSNALDNLGTGGRKVPKGVEPARLVDRVDHPIDTRMKLANLTTRGEELIAKMRAALGERRSEGP